MVTQSQQFGQDARRQVRETAITELSRAFVTPAAQLEGAPPELTAAVDLWNALKVVNPNLPEPPTEAQLRAVATEFIDRRTVGGVAFNPSNPTHQQLLTALNGKVPTAHQLNAMGNVVDEAVRESTGDIQMLGGMKLGNLIEALIEGFMKWMQNGFKGGMKGLFDSIKLAGFEATRSEAMDRTRAGMDDLVRRGIITQEMADRAVGGVGDGMTERAHGSGIPVTPPPAVVPMAGLIAGHRPVAVPGAPTPPVDAAAMAALPTAERLPALFRNMAEGRVNLIAGARPEFAPMLNSARDTFVRIATERSASPGALADPQRFANDTMMETMLSLANQNNFQGIFDRSKIEAARDTGNWERALDVLVREDQRGQLAQLKQHLLAPMHASLVAQNRNIREYAAGRTPSQEALAAAAAAVPVAAPIDVHAEARRQIRESLMPVLTGQGGRGNRIVSNILAVAAAQDGKEINNQLLCDTVANVVARYEREGRRNPANQTQLAQDIQAALQADSRIGLPGGETGNLIMQQLSQQIATRAVAPAGGGAPAGVSDADANRMLDQFIGIVRERTRAGLDAHNRSSEPYTFNERDISCVLDATETAMRNIVTHDDPTQLGIAGGANTPFGRMTPPQRHSLVRDTLVREIGSLARERGQLNRFGLPGAGRNTITHRVAGNIANETVRPGGHQRPDSSHQPLNNPPPAPPPPPAVAPVAARVDAPVPVNPAFDALLHPVATPAPTPAPPALSPEEVRRRAEAYAAAHGTGPAPGIVPPPVGPHHGLSGAPPHVTGSHTAGVGTLPRGR